MIVCWEHNWLECPEQIEIIELSSLIGKIEDIAEEVKKPKMFFPIGNSFVEIKGWKERPFRKLENYGKSNEVNVISTAINRSKNILLSV